MAIFEKFTMTEEHLKLLDRMDWEWGEYGRGAPCVDSKRPYGNSMVAPDVIDILEWETPEDGANEALWDRAMQVHRETLNAIQIIMQLRTFEPGEYMRIGDTWSRAKRSN